MAWHTEFAYDGLSRRIETREYANGSLASAKRHVYDGWLPVAELNETNGLVSTMTWGLDLSISLEGAGRALHRTEGSGAGGIGGLLSLTRHSTPDTLYYFYDGNGNVTDVLDDSDTLAAHYEYDPFGNRLVADGPYADQPFQWSTKMHHEASRLVYYGYRFLKPDIGRWLNRDPIEEGGGTGIYIFALNGAVDNVDVLGLRLYRLCCRDVCHTLFAPGYRCCGREAIHPNYYHCCDGRPYRYNPWMPPSSNQCCLNGRICRYLPRHECEGDSLSECMTGCRVLHLVDMAVLRRLCGRLPTFRERLACRAAPELACGIYCSMHICCENTCD